MQKTDDIVLTNNDWASRFMGYWILSMSVMGLVASIYKLAITPTLSLFWFIPLVLIFLTLGFALAFVQCDYTLHHNPLRIEEWMTVVGRRVSSVLHPVGQFDCLLIQSYYVQHSPSSGGHEMFKLVARARAGEAKNLCLLDGLTTVEEAGSRVGELSRAMNLPWQMG